MKRWMVALLVTGCATSHSLDRGDDERPRVEVARAGSPKMRTAGYVLVAIGGVLAVGAIAAGAASNSSGCRDESCWLPQLTAGATLGALGGSLAITGGALAIAGRDR